MNLQLHNAVDTPIDLGAKYLLSIDPWAPRVKAEDHVGRSGGYPVGDWESSSRGLRLTRNIGYTSDAAFIAAANQIPRFMRKAAEPHYIVDVDTSRRCLIAPQSLAAEWAGGLERRQMTGDLKFIMLLAVWESLTATTTEALTLASGSSLVVPNTSDRDIFGVTTIEALTDLPEFTIINEATGFGFQFSNVAMVAGTLLEIDPATPGGSIRMGNASTGWVDASTSIVDGSPYMLLPVGNSPLRFTSAYGACRLTVQTRGEWPE